MAYEFWTRIEPSIDVSRIIYANSQPEAQLIAENYLDELYSDGDESDFESFTRRRNEWVYYNGVIITLEPVTPITVTELVRGLAINPVIGDYNGNPDLDCAETVQGSFCPNDGEPMRKVAEVRGVDKVAYYDCPSCDGWTFDDSEGAFYAGVPSWADELQKAISVARNLPESLGIDGSITLYDR